ncbi:cytochrome P450 [Serendipita vermifera]|nr:cytochrome P450 [Serendipita vermifera]
MNVQSKLLADAISTISSYSAKEWAMTLGAVTGGYIVLKTLRGLVFAKTQPVSYPPGPPREFLIGTLRSFPKAQFLETFCEWATTYGDIVYSPLPGNEIVILNSYEVTQELLSKRPSSTAGRNLGYLTAHLIGFHWNMPNLQPGPSHSNQRKMLRRAIGPQQVGKHDPMIESAVMKLMTRLSIFQGCPSDLVQSALGEMVSKAAYGTQIWKEMGDDLSHWNKEAVAIGVEAVFSFWLVNVFHFLRFIPDWVPGIRFKQLSKHGRDIADKIRYRAFNKAVGLYKSGALEHTILYDLFEEFGESDDVRDAVGSLYSAGADTTTGAVIQFLHTLFLFPETGERVFKEIQSITQGHRLPKVSDRQNFPFTEAVWKESLRWRPFFPIGVPHVSSQDEIVKGYFIPKGALIHANTKMILNDPKLWGDPEAFRPERFLEPNASQLPNPLTVHCGWGMRQCPGMYFADRVAFHLVTTIISLYKVEPLEGSKIPNPDSIEYAPPGIQQPVGFECRFTVRDEKAQHLLRTISLSE